MNMVLLFGEDIIDSGKACISGRRARHILSVHRADKGKTLTVGMIDGKLGKGIVTDINDEKIEMELCLDTPPPEPLPLTLIMALPRPKSFRKALHCAVSMGIKKIFVIETWKVDKSYWASPVIEAESVREEILLALEQAKDTVMPDVIFKRRFKPFIEDDAPLIGSGTEKLIADPYAIESCPFNIGRPVSIAIGPEGGFTEYELKSFQAAGFRSVGIGARILRVEFAVAAITGRLFGI